MSEHTSNAGDDEAREIELLLPWYATDRLNAEEAAWVSAYLLQHPEMAQQLDIIAEDREAAIAANEDIAPLPDAAVDRLIRDAVVGEEERLESSQLSAKPACGSFLERFADWLSPGRLGWVAAAAVGVIALQAGVIGSLTMRGTAPGAVYEVAGGGEAGDAASAHFVLVRFRDGATVETIAAFLKAQRAEIVSGPKAGGLFKVKVVPAERLDTDQTKSAFQDKVLKVFQETSDVIQMVMPSR